MRFVACKLKWDYFISISQWWWEGKRKNFKIVFIIIIKTQLLRGKFKDVIESRRTIWSKPKPWIKLQGQSFGKNWYTTVIKLSSVVLTTSADSMILQPICRALNTIWQDIAPQSPHCPHYHSPTAMSRLHSSAMNPKLLLNVNTRCSSQITDRIIVLLVPNAHLGNLEASHHLLVGECLHEHHVHVYALTPVMTAWQIIPKIDTILPTALNTPKTSSISSRISKS